MVIPDYASVVKTARMCGNVFRASRTFRVFKCFVVYRRVSLGVEQGNLPGGSTFSLESIPWENGDNYFPPILYEVIEIRHDD